MGGWGAIPLNQITKWSDFLSNDTEDNYKIGTWVKLQKDKCTDGKTTKQVSVYNEKWTNRHKFNIYKYLSNKHANKITTDKCTERYKYKNRQMFRQTNEQTNMQTSLQHIYLQTEKLTNKQC